MSDYIMVVTTTNSEDLAKNIANELVNTRIAACVNIIPNILSIYKWKNDLCVDKELLLLIKSRSVHFNAIRDKIKSLHSYELPEVVAIPLSGGDVDYLNWIDRCTDTTAESPGY